MPVQAPNLGKGVLKIVDLFGEKETLATRAAVVDKYVRVLELKRSHVIALGLQGRCRAQTEIMANLRGF